MKTLFILIVFGCLFSVNHVSAQQTKDEMLPVVTITATTTNVNQKVRKAFERSFRNAEQMRWYEANQNFLVKFILDDQEHSVLYRKNGRPIYDIAYGYKGNLPAATWDLVKSKYKNFKIARVFNVKQDRRDIWIVNLENKDYIILSRIEDNVLNEIRKLRNIKADEISARAKQ